MPLLVASSLEPHVRGVSFFQNPKRASLVALHRFLNQIAELH